MPTLGALPHLAQGQDRRADQGFFDNLRSMAGAVSHLRTEQRHADAAAHVYWLPSPSTPAMAASSTALPAHRAHCEDVVQQVSPQVD